MKFYIIQKSILILLFFSIPQLILAEISRDLELESIYTTIKHTRTIHGSSALKNMLATPISDIERLQNRQTAIAGIAHNPALYQQLSSLLDTFSTQEPHFDQILHPATDIESAAIENFYFSSDYFKSWNYSPTHLELGQIGYLCNLCSSLAQHSLSYAIFTWGLEEQHSDHCTSCPSEEPTAKTKKHDRPHGHKNKNDKPKKDAGDTDTKHSHHDKECADGTCINTDHKHHHHHHPKSNNPFTLLVQSPGFRKAFQIWHGIAQIQELYSIQGVVRNHVKCITRIQKQLMGIAQGMRTLRQINTLLETHPQICNYVPHYSDLKNICESTNISDKLAQCLQLLQTKTFTGKPSAFSRIGIILATYKLMQDIADELEPALSAIGEIDAYVNCAELLKNSQSEPLQYSFARYITNSKTPSLLANNLWHPLSTPDTVQLNSIHLGYGNQPHHIIITGPNASGKSTSLKSITLCAYLAQTLTIVPAQEYSHTLYKEIYSSMIVTDNLSENRSLFATELNNAEELLTHVANLQEDEYMLVVLDELFKSTHHEKGQKVAYQLLTHLYQFPNVITIVSTHFENLVALADIPENKCANYTLDNFKLVPGIGSHDHAFDIVKKQIRSHLLE